jgi:O-antigen/teichoic acid export membrane protein
MVAIGLNYVFLLGAGRLLGSESYGDLAALMGLLTLVLLPTGAVQLAVSREISRRRAVGGLEEADGFTRAVVRVGLLATIPVTLAGLVLAVPLRHLLNIDSTGAVMVAAVALVAAFTLPIATGALQGFERFGAVAAMYVLPFALRVALLALAAAAGLRLQGAVLAAVLATVVSAAVALGLLADPLRGFARATRPSLRPFLRYLWPVVVGMLGVAVLTNVDILVVNARFEGSDTGEYAAAAAFAKVAFFLPATILAVLFPRTAARQARGEDATDILGRTLLATAAFGGALALFYAMTGRGLLHSSFGAEFAEGGDLLVAFTIAMGLFALVNVLLGYHLSRAETRYAWIVAGAVPVQIAILALVPNGMEGVIWADAAIATALLCAHEILVDSSVPALGAGFRHVAKAVSVARATVVETLVVLLAATAFVCLLFWPLIADLGSLVVGPGSDSTGTVYMFWSWTQEGGYHLFGQTHHTLTGAPFGWDGDNGLNIQWLIAYYPAYLLTTVVGEVAAHNLVLLAGYVLSGASMYLLVRYLGCGRLVAAWAGMVYIIFPWHLERTPHASLVHLEFMPLVLLALVAAARQPGFGRFVFVAIAILACWLTSGYFGAIAAISAVAFALAASFVVVRRRWWFVVGTTASAAAATLLVAFLSTISGVGRGSGLQRVASDLKVYGLRPLELILPSGNSIVFGRWLEPFWDSRQHGSSPTETSNYLGLLTIALALSWIVLAWRRWPTLTIRLRAASVGFVAIGIAAFLLALPGAVTLFGHEVRAPSRLLWEAVPPFRVPTRWTVMTMAALVPLAALALQAACDALARRRLRSDLPVLPAVLVGVAMLVSFGELAVNPIQNRIHADRLPPEYAALAQTRFGPLVEYPLIQNIDQLFWQRIHKRPVLNSEAFGYPPDEARRTVLHPAAPGTAGRLAFLGVTAIVTHRDALRYTESAPETPNASWGPGYQLVTRTGDGSSVWRVTAPPSPALVTLHSGFGEPRPPEGNRVDFPLVSSSGVGYFEIRSREPGLLRLTFEAESPDGSPRVLRLADADGEVPFTIGERTPISLLVDVPSGLSYLLVKTDPAATSVDDAIDVTAPLAERASGTAQLQAEPISPDIGF